MAHAGSFENYLKDSVLDLSSIENNRETTTSQKMKVENAIVKAFLIIRLSLEAKCG